MSNHKLNHHIGEDTSVVIQFDYTPEQEEIIYPDEKSQPHYPAQIEINQVLIGDDDIKECLNEGCLDDLEIACWGHIAELEWEKA